MTTHESYVSLETAKMLKETGFDWEVNTCYYYNDPMKVSSNGSLRSNFNGYAFQHITVSAPTLAVAQRWLREEKGWFLEPHYFGEDYFEEIYEYGYVETEDDFMHKYPNKSFYMCYGYFENCMYIDEDRSTYEEALEAGIQKCLTILLEDMK